MLERFLSSFLVRMLFLLCLLKCFVSEQSYLYLSEDRKTVTGILKTYKGAIEIPDGVEII